MNLRGLVLVIVLIAMSAAHGQPSSDFELAAAWCLGFREGMERELLAPIPELDCGAMPTQSGQQECLKTRQGMETGKLNYLNETKRLRTYVYYKIGYQTQPEWLLIAIQNGRNDWAFVESAIVSQSNACHPQCYPAELNNYAACMIRCESVLAGPGTREASVRTRATRCIEIIKALPF